MYDTYTMNCLDWAWVAGILEGEGSFIFSGGYPRISLQMTDEDIVRRIADYFDVKVSMRRPKNPKHKDIYQIHIIKREVLIECYLELYKYLGSRRRQAIQKFHYFWTHRRGLLLPDMSK